MQESVDYLIREARFAGPVYMGTGITSAVRAVLARTETDLVLMTSDDEVFRAPLPMVEKVEFPWWLFGGAMRVTVGGTRYMLSFSPPATLESEDTDWLRNVGGGLYGSEKIAQVAASARQSSKEWKVALAGVGGHS